MIGPAEIGVMCFLAGLLIGAGVALSVTVRTIRDLRRAIKDTRAYAAHVERMQSKRGPY